MTMADKQINENQSFLSFQTLKKRTAALKPEASLVARVTASSAGVFRVKMVSDNFIRVELTLPRLNSSKLSSDKTPTRESKSH